MATLKIKIRTANITLIKIISVIFIPISVFMFTLYGMYAEPVGKTYDTQNSSGDYNSEGAWFPEDVLPPEDEGLLLKEKYVLFSDKDIPGEGYNSFKYPYYNTVLKQYEENGYQPPKNTGENEDNEDNVVNIIKLSPETINTNIGANLKLSYNVNERKEASFIWTDDIKWIEWEFNIKAEGLYQFNIEYLMPEGESMSSVRKLYVDDHIQFLEANNIVFYRIWDDEGEPIFNNIGDEVRPRQVEIREWQNMDISDANGLYRLPFKFFFNRGKHKVRMEYVDRELILGDFIIKPVEEPMEYEKLKAEYLMNNYKNASATIKFQAEENVIYKNDVTVRMESDGDPLCEPASATQKLLNTMGGYRWRKGGQSITWEFNVPEDGLYKIGLRVFHNWNDGLPAYRQISIDGKVPFKEMEAYKFKNQTKWRTEELKDDRGNPYLFYLTKGKHTISMTVKMGDLTDIICTLNDDAFLLSNIIRDIVKITGSTPDPNYDYDLFNQIPSLKHNMYELKESLFKKYNMLKDVTDKVPAMANNFLTIIDQLNDMMANPFSIAKKLQDLNNALTSISAWYISIQNLPLLIDYFQICAPDAKLENAQANIFTRILATFKNFLTSFNKDYNSIGSTFTDFAKVNKKINVWIARGTEWAELIKQMADEEFTPISGIMVNINVLPAGQLHAGNANALMLSILSGKAPDAALGVDLTSPVEFAIRDAVIDLSAFDDFNNIKSMFLENIFVPYEYRGGVYAIPETMDFNVMFYRKDIVNELGIKLPETREDLYNHVLPMLYHNGLQFYYPAVGSGMTLNPQAMMNQFSQFLFQHGGDFYSADRLSSALDTAEAYRAFKEYTGLFTNYGIPTVANFFNRFRTGEMPIGISGFSTYIQLSVAAPELAGRWGIAPLPGIRRADGSINRAYGGMAGQCSIILTQSRHKKEAWEFIKWWSDTSVQTRFAREIEALVGTEAKWNTANVNAFTNLSWNKEDFDVIVSQWEWTKEIPVVLGGYFTGRHLVNAWNDVVISGKPVRDALEKGIKEINKELKMKQEEYGIINN